MTETIAGLFAAVVIIVLSRLLQRFFTLRLFTASVLVAIAFIYVGFSLKANPVSAIMLECTVALGFYFLALIGYTRNSRLIATGIILHGVWDLLHHSGFFIGTDIPGYWPSFCLTIDIVDGIYFLFIFRKQTTQVQLG